MTGGELLCDVMHRVKGIFECLAIIVLYPYTSGTLSVYAQNLLLAIFYIHCSIVAMACLRLSNK